MFWPVKYIHQPTTPHPGGFGYCLFLSGGSAFVDSLSIVWVFLFDHCFVENYLQSFLVCVCVFLVLICNAVVLCPLDLQSSRFCNVHVVALLFVVLLSCGCWCSMPRLRGTVGWTVVCNVAFPGYTHLLLINIE